MFEQAPRIRRRCADRLSTKPRTRLHHKLALLGVGLAFATGMGCAESDQASLLVIRFDGVNVPHDVDSFCLGLWDSDENGGHFGQRYELLSTESATLAIEPGTATGGRLLLQGYSFGRRVALQQQNFSFATGEIEAQLDYCGPGRDTVAVERDRLDIAEGSTMAVSQGPEGAWIVLASPGFSEVLKVGGQGIERLSVPVPTTAGAQALVATDVDGDCDEDILVLDVGGASLWRRERGALVASLEPLPNAGAFSTAGVPLDANGDLFMDVALVGALGLTIWLGSDSGFTAGLVDGTLDDATAIAAGDLDGDGHVDLAIARRAKPDRLLYGDGFAGFLMAEDALPPSDRLSRGIAMADLDGDGSLDIVVTSADEGVTAYSATQGRLYADQSVSLLPANELIADGAETSAITAADWNGDCAADLLIAGEVTSNWASGAGGGLGVEPAPALTREVLLDDLLGGGERDALLLSDTQLLWWRR